MRELKALPGFAYKPLSVDCDLSMHTLESAWCEAYRLSDLEPDALFISPADEKYVTEVIEMAMPPIKRLTVTIVTDLPSDTWLVGNLEAPTRFSGSPGA